MLGWLVFVSSVDGPVGAWLSRGRACDADKALSDAREIGQATTLILALFDCFVDPCDCGNITRQQTRLSMNCRHLADEKGAPCPGRLPEWCSEVFSLP